MGTTSRSKNSPVRDASQKRSDDARTLRRSVANQSGASPRRGGFLLDGPRRPRAEERRDVVDGLLEVLRLRRRVRLRVGDLRDLLQELEVRRVVVLLTAVGDRED